MHNPLRFLGVFNTIERMFESVLAVLLGEADVDAEFAAMLDATLPDPYEVPCPAGIATYDPADPACGGVLSGRLAPGPRAVHELASLDPELLGARERATYVEQVEANLAWLGSLSMAGIAALAAPRDAAGSESGHGVGWAAGSASDAEPAGEAGTAAEAAEQAPVLGSPEPDRLGLEYARLALNCSESFARERVMLATDLRDRLPGTRALVQSGKLSLYRAGLVSESTRRLSAPQCAAVEARVLPKAVSLPVTRLKQTLTRVSRLEAGEDHLARHLSAVSRESGLRSWDAGDGMGALQLTAPALWTAEIEATLRAEAKAAQRAAVAAGHARERLGVWQGRILLRWSRSARLELAGLGLMSCPHTPYGDSACACCGQTLPVGEEDRAWLLAEQVSGVDGLAACSEPTGSELLAWLASPEPGVDGHDGGSDHVDPLNPLGLDMGPSAQIRVGVVIEAADLLLAQEQGGLARLERYGDLPAELVQILADDAEWRRFILEDADGHLLDFGRTRYAPTGKLRDYLLGGGQDCRCPGCAAKPVETDHAKDWALGGPTSAANLNGLCWSSHQLKTVYGFGITKHPDGTVTWTTPAGNTYTKPPDDLRITSYGRPLKTGPPHAPDG